MGEEAADADAAAHEEQAAASGHEGPAATTKAEMGEEAADATAAHDQEEQAAAAAATNKGVDEKTVQ